MITYADIYNAFVKSDATSKAPNNDEDERVKKLRCLGKKFLALRDCDATAKINAQEFFNLVRILAERKVQFNFETYPALIEITSKIDFRIVCDTASLISKGLLSFPTFEAIRLSGHCEMIKAIGMLYEFDNLTSTSSYLFNITKHESPLAAAKVIIDFKRNNIPEENLLPAVDYVSKNSFYVYSVCDAFKLLHNSGLLTESNRANVLAGDRPAQAAEKILQEQNIQNSKNNFPSLQLNHFTIFSALTGSPVEANSRNNIDNSP